MKNAACVVVFALVQEVLYGGSEQFSRVGLVSNVLGA